MVATRVFLQSPILRITFPRIYQFQSERYSFFSSDFESDSPVEFSGTLHVESMVRLEDGLTITRVYLESGSVKLKMYKERGSSERFTCLLSSEAGLVMFRVTCSKKSIHLSIFLEEQSRLL